MVCRDFVIKLAKERPERVVRERQWKGATRQIAGKITILGTKMLWT